MSFAPELMYDYGGIFFLGDRLNKEKKEGLSVRGKKLKRHCFFFLFEHQKRVAIQWKHLKMGVIHSVGAFPGFYFTKFYIKMGLFCKWAFQKWVSLGESKMWKKVVISVSSKNFWTKSKWPKMENGLIWLAQNVTSEGHIQYIAGPLVGGSSCSFWWII